MTELTSELGVITRDDSVTITGAPMLAMVYRSVLLGIRQHRTDGLPSSDLLALAKVLRRAHINAMSGSGHELADPAPGQPCCACRGGADLIGVSEAAVILSISPRQARRLAAQVGLGGVRIGKAWALDRSAVLALAEQRKAAAK
jgi:hypothetical protein